MGDYGYGYTVTGRRRVAAVCIGGTYCLKNLGGCVIAIERPHRQRRCVWSDDVNIGLPDEGIGTGDVHVD